MMGGLGRVEVMVCMGIHSVCTVNEFVGRYPFYLCMVNYTMLHNNKRHTDGCRGGKMGF